MALDKIKEIVEDIVEKLKADPELLKNFKEEPVKTLEKLLNVDLPDDQIKKIVAGVKAKLALDDADSKLGGALNDIGDKLGGFFR